MRCGVTDEGLLALCIGLQSNSKISLLDLSGNHITSNGFECLIDCLEYGLPLNYLILQENEIEEFSVAEFIKTTKTLTILNLAGNRLDVGGLWKLLDAVENNKSLLEVYADQKTDLTSPKLIYKLCEVLGDNRTLQKLVLDIPIPASIVCCLCF